MTNSGNKALKNCVLSYHWWLILYWHASIVGYQVLSLLVCQHCWLPDSELLATRFGVCWSASIAGYQILSCYFLVCQHCWLPIQLQCCVFLGLLYIYIYVSISVEGSNLLVQQANTYTNSSLWFPLKDNVEKSTPKT